MNLFIGNLNPTTSEDSLRTLFSEFGEIVSVKVPVDAETGAPRGFGFVEMADKFEGFDAIDNIDGIYFEGQVITVKESRPKGGGNNRGGGRGGYNRNGGNRGGYGGNRDGGGYNRDNRGGYGNRDGGGYNRDSRGGYGNRDGGGYNRDNRGGYGNREGGGYNRDNRGGYGNRDGGGYRERRSDDRRGYDDPNRQPGRRFSPRGPRPDNKED